MALASGAPADAAELSTLAVAGFSFKDTSGEVRDQTAEHAARLKAFGAVLHDDLSASPKIDLVALPCEADRCGDLGSIATQARAASAKYLLVGEVHKMSTLIGWVKFVVLDLSENKPVCDRYLTYRGDTDEAWRRGRIHRAGCGEVLHTVGNARRVDWHAHSSSGVSGPGSPPAAAMASL
ncbi:DUF2380 domain-containing protein [Mesorhizobium sp. M0488]|uniref:DUF2380 domain-containing protein n=1 Tax=unclassified Mesorhizobium TaxID=325217 RepID=UPI0033360856